MKTKDFWFSVWGLFCLSGIFLAVIILFLGLSSQKTGSIVILEGQAYYEIEVEGKVWVIRNRDMAINLEKKEILFIARDEKTGKKMPVTVHYTDWQRKLVDIKISKGIKQALENSKPAH